MAFQLTSRGTRDIETPGRRMGPDTTVLNYLYEMGNQPTEITAIEAHTRMSEDKTISVLKNLISRDLIEEI